MKAYLLVAAAFLAGTLLGSAVHPMAVKAQNMGVDQNRGMTIRVQEVQTNGPTRLHDVNLRGFSCIADSSGRACCFAASE